MSRVALVTGGTRGIGAAIAKALKAAGYNVAAVYHGNDEAAQKFKAETGIAVYKWDVSSFEACAAGVKQVEAELGPIDVLVNNAGITGDRPQEPTVVDPATVRTVVETNVIGVIRVTNAMLPLLRRSASPRIVNMSSGVGSLTRQSDPHGETGPISAAYAPSKTMLNALTVQYAKELRDTNILINAACPGYTATDLNGFRGVRTPEQGAAIAIRLATLPDGGPTGGYFEDAGMIPW